MVLGPWWHEGFVTGCEGHGTRWAHLTGPSSVSLACLNVTNRMKSSTSIIESWHFTTLWFLNLTEDLKWTHGLKLCAEGFFFFCLIDSPAVMWVKSCCFLHIIENYEMGSPRYSTRQKGGFLFCCCFLLLFWLLKWHVSILETIW